MSYDFKYVPTSGSLSGESLISQTEIAFNEIGVQVEGAIESSGEANASAESAVKTATEALTTANDALSSAQNAEIKADDAIKKAEGAENSAGTAVSKADQAYDLAVSAKNESEAATGNSSNAEKLATEAKEASAKALEDAAAAVLTSESAKNIAEEAKDFYIEELDPDDANDANDADELIYALEKTYFSGEGELLNFPLEAPLWFKVQATKDYNEVTQDCWNGTKAKRRVIEVGEDLTPKFGEWYALGGEDSVPISGAAQTSNYEQVDITSPSTIEIKPDSPNVFNFDLKNPLSITGEPFAPTLSKMVTLNFSKDSTGLGITWPALVVWANEDVPDFAMSNLVVVLSYTNGLILGSILHSPEELVLVFQGDAPFNINLNLVNRGNASRDIIISWGDGTSSTYNDLPESGGLPHSFAEGSHKVTITAGYLNTNLMNQVRLIQASGSFPKSADWTTESAFSGCTNLQSVSSNIFKNNLETTSFNSTFSGCTSLQNIPSNIFKSNQKVIRANSTFHGCISLQNIPPDIFKNNPKVISFGGAFYGCPNITSAVPPLWDKTLWPEALGNGCFQGCTKAANYAEIPAGWK